MSLSRSKRLGLVDVYMKYKYKKNIKHPQGTTPQPFVKFSEVTDHKLSTDWNEWRDVVELYIEKLKLHLEEGNTIQLGSRLGEFHLTKRKSDRFIDFKKSREQGKVVKFYRNGVDNYYLYYSWARRVVHLKLKSFWKIKLNRKWIRNLYLKCEKDYTKIYKIRDSQ